LGAQAVYGFGSVNNSLKYDEKAADSEGLAVQKKRKEKKIRFLNGLANIHLASALFAGGTAAEGQKQIKCGTA